MHFTYQAPQGDLGQGDVLKRTEALNALLKEAHPYYLGEEYQFFMVLTQTCDLVRRGGGPCGARYITVASVRPMNRVLQRHLRTFQGEFEQRAGVCSEKIKNIFIQFVKRLLNNNEDEYFYLRQQGDCGIAEDMCAFLRESIPVRARDHYQTLLDARIVSLEPTFQAKLGWLVGHIFSRVGTADWVPTATDISAFDQMANSIVDETCTWVDDRKLKQARKSAAAADPATLTDARIQELIKKAKASTHRSEVLERVCHVIEEKYPDQAGGLKNMRQILGSDNELKVFLGA